MKIPGKRLKKIRFIQSPKYIVAVEVEIVIPMDDPSEPCYEAETVQFLKDVQTHVEQGDVAWLAQYGKVYTALEAA